MYSKAVRRGVAALLVIPGMILAGCSSTSSGSSSSSDAAANGTTSAGVAPSGGSSAAGSVAAEAKSRIADYLERAVSIPNVTPPIPVTEPLKQLPTGKTMVYVQCGVPECAFIAEQLKPAVEVLGAKLKVIKAGASAQSVADAFQSALALKPDVIIEDAIDPATWTDQLNAIRAANIPIVAWTIPEPAPAGISMLFDSAKSFANAGKLMADYILAQSGEDARAVLFWPPEYTVFQSLATAFADEIKEKCPKCTADVVKVPASTIGSTAPSRIVSYVQQHPDTNWVAGGFGSVLIGVPQALQAAGLSGKVQLIEQAGGKVNWQYMQEGKQAVDLASDLKIESWFAADAAARLATGQEISSMQQGARTPEQFLTKDDITFNLDEGWTAVPDYQEYFKKLWGVSH